MANEEQLEILKSGVQAWNGWRRENRDAEIDLSRADLEKANLIGADLTGGNLSGADLRWAISWCVDFLNANLCEADLSGGDFQIANFTGANLYGTSLYNARLYEANLTEANLEKANLQRAELIKANFRWANLSATRLSEAKMGHTILGFIDLSDTIGLEEVIHDRPSSIGMETLINFRGRVPKEFLRGCGLSDWEIESAKLYQPGLSAKEGDEILYRIHDLRFGQALQINPLFISYSHKDSAFVDAMEKHLDKKGIRFWRDIHDATAGRLEKVVDRAMSQNPTVLLVLSKNSVQSDWVEHEARSARELEKELKRDVLCPVALDGAWKDCPWPVRLSSNSKSETGLWG